MHKLEDDRCIFLEAFCGDRISIGLSHVSSAVVDKLVRIPDNDDVCCRLDTSTVGYANAMKETSSYRLNCDRERVS